MKEKAKDNTERGRESDTQEARYTGRDREEERNRGREEERQRRNRKDREVGNRRAKGKREEGQCRSVTGRHGTDGSSRRQRDGRGQSFTV